MEGGVSTIEEGHANPGLVNVRCPACDYEHPSVSFYPGRFPKCWQCGVQFVSMGKTPDAPCVTPNGRIDGHGMYVVIQNGYVTCAFCGAEV